MTQPTAMQATQHTPEPLPGAGHVRVGGTFALLAACRLSEVDYVERLALAQLAPARRVAQLAFDLGG